MVANLVIMTAELIGMTRVRGALVAVVLACGVHAAPVQKAVRASLIQLIGVPPALEGKRILTEGFASFDFEGAALYVSEADYLNNLSFNGISLTLTADDLKKYASMDKKYVYAVGIYSGKDRGHYEVSSGNLRVESLAVIPTAPSRP